MPSYNKHRPSSNARSSFKSRSSYGSFSSRPRNTKQRTGQYIDPTKFVRAAEPVEQSAYTPTHTFNDFAIHPTLKQNLAKKGFTTPSPIQDQTIPLGLQGKDIIGIANTGTGKTAAFAIPVLNRLMAHPGRALIIAPTRELAQQIEEELRSIGKNCGIYSTLLIGGTKMGPQLRSLRSNPSVIIGTPGRVKDHIERNSLVLQRFDMVVLDEVDRMLDMGFVIDVRFILSHLAPKRQSSFFSATLDSRVNDLIQTFANDPVTVSLKLSATSENVNQDVVRHNSNTDKMEKLHDILLKSDLEKIIVFDATQRSVDKLSKELIARGFQADSIHGGKTQGQRRRALDRFKQNEVNILVATDVAARGIDVADITHVINYTVPQSYNDYIHRIGRAGRAGRVGHALTFVSGR